MRQQVTICPLPWPEPRRRKESDSGMKAGIPTILKNMQIDKVPVPAGDRAEQLIANLILSILAAQLNAHATATEYLVQARSLAVNLANETLTYRPLRPSKFARLTFEMGGETGQLVFPIINDILVIPTIRLDVKGCGAEIPRVANIMGFDVTYFMLRLRTRRTLAVLEDLTSMTSLERLAEAAANFLSECLYNEKSSADPLQRADDCLGVARDLLGKGNFALAFLALTNVDSALDSFVKMPSMADHLGVAQGMRDQVKRMMGQLRQSSS
jgi:hypothetical protein